MLIAESKPISLLRPFLSDADPRKCFQKKKDVCQNCMHLFDFNYLMIKSNQNLLGFKVLRLENRDKNV